MTLSLNMQTSTIIANTSKTKEIVFRPPNPRLHVDATPLFLVLNKLMKLNFLVSFPLTTYALICMYRFYTKNLLSALYKGDSETKD
jgi:hypothetical protein